MARTSWRGGRTDRFRGVSKQRPLEARARRELAVLGSNTPKGKGSLWAALGAGKKNQNLNASQVIERLTDYVTRGYVTDPKASGDVRSVRTLGRTQARKLVTESLQKAVSRWAAGQEATSSGKSLAGSRGKGAPVQSSEGIKALKSYKEALAPSLRQQQRVARLRSRYS